MTLKCAICDKPTEVPEYIKECCCSFQCAVVYDKKHNCLCPYVGPMTENEYEE
jgi:hypothetical protein